MNVLSPVLHLLLINFKPHAGEVQRRVLVEELRRLHDIDGVLHVGAARAAGEASTHAQALSIYLRDGAALEAYGSHPLHMEYLRRVFLPTVQDFASIDVGVQGEPPTAYGAAACCCASFRPDTYDWQIRSLFEKTANVTEAHEGRTVSGGTALSDRQHYRAAAIVFWSEGSRSREKERHRVHRRLLDDAWGPFLSEELFVSGPAHPPRAPSP